jgi:hypothetical protein
VELSNVVSKALTRDLDQRYGSMKEFSQALGQVMKLHGGVADATEIADYVQGKFTYQLGEIDAMLKEAAMSVAPPVEPFQTREDPTSKTMARGQEPVRRDIDTEDVEPLAYDDHRPRKGSKLVVALAIAGLAMSALAVAIVLQKNSSATQQTVLVQGAGLTPEDDGPRPASHQPSLTSDAGSEAAQAVFDAAPAAIKVKPVSKGNRCDGMATAEERNKCYVRSGSGGLTACISKHAETAAGTSQLVLSFDLDKSGRVKEVGVAPAVVESSALGACVKNVAKKIRFGKQSDNLRFRIPLRISQR